MQIRDEFDEVLHKADLLLDQWDKAQRRANAADVRFKAWEARQKETLMDAGMSAVRAESTVRSGEEWAKNFLFLEERRQDAALVKEQYQQEIRRWETERSRQANLRKIV